MLRSRSVPAIWLILLMAAATVNGCGRAPAPAPPVADERFAILLADVLVFQERYAEKPDSLARQRAALLDSAGVTEAQIHNYIKGLKSRPNEWVPLLDRVEARLDSLKKTRPDTTTKAERRIAPPIGSTEAERYRVK